MIARVVAAVLLIVTLPGCAAAFWIPPDVTIDEYDGVRVRVYRAGRTCRIEVITAADTIQTWPTKCLRVPLRKVT